MRQLHLGSALPCGATEPKTSPILPCQKGISPLTRRTPPGGFRLSELTDFASQAGAIDGVALHREKLGALYVDAHSDGIRSPCAFSEARARAELDRAERLVMWTKAQLGAIDPAAIEAAALVGNTLTEALEQYVLEHGIDAGIHLTRQLAEWGRTQALLQANDPEHGSSGK